MPVSGTMTNWGEAIMTSTAAALAMFLGGIPKVIAFLVILLVGWLIASAMSSLVAGLLRTVKFNDLATRSGITGFVHNMGWQTDPAGLVATITKWFVRLIVLVVAFDALGLPAVSRVLQDLLLWIPNLIVAIMVLVIGGLAANALGGVVRGATASGGLGNPAFLSNLTRIAVMGFAIVIAVNQIGIATTLVNTLFMGFIGALALALGLAFGLGGRDTASQIVRDWYEGGRAQMPRLQRTAEAAREQVTSGPAPTTTPSTNLPDEERRIA
jgi:mechanosensitive ion channel-like protein